MKSFDVSVFPRPRRSRLTAKRLLLWALIFAFYMTTALSFSTSNFSREPLSSMAPSFSSVRSRGCRSSIFRLLGTSSGTPPSPSPSSGTEGESVSNNKLSLLFQLYTFMRFVAGNVLPRGMKKESRRHGRRSRLKLVESAAFKGLSEWAFSVCDSEGDGKIHREELYTGVLLVHLHLAKYVGVAACQPLNRTQVGELFDTAASHNNAKTIGQREFEDIVMYSCAQIGYRIGVYYSMLLVLAPFLTGRLLRAARYFKNALQLELHFGGHWGPWFEPLWAVGEWLVEHTVSVSMFVLAVPWTFTKIDPYTRRLIKPRKKPKNVFWWQKVQNVQKQLLVATSAKDVEEILRNVTAKEDNTTTGEIDDEYDDEVDEMTEISRNATAKDTNIVAVVDNEVRGATKEK